MMSEEIEQYQNSDKKTELDEEQSLKVEEEAHFTSSEFIDEKEKEIQKKLEAVTTEFISNRTDWWEYKEWQDYFYKTKELGCLRLPVINEFLSEWREDDEHDPKNVFERCHQCLKFIEDLKFAIRVCPNATQKSLDRWEEGIENIKETISKKLDLMTFFLLKDAEKYINPKTNNMEYFTRDTNDKCIVTLCLWANLHRPARKQGISILGYGFKLPMDIVMEDCAVRLMHTSFDHVTPKRVEKEVEVTEDEESCFLWLFQDSDTTSATEDQVNTEEAETVKIAKREEDDSKLTTETEEEGRTDKTQDDRLEENQDDRLEENQDGKEETQATSEGGITTDASEAGEESEVSETASEEHVIFDSSMLPPLVEPDIQVVDSGEYFVVGGVFHFDLFVVPTVTSYGNVFTYIYHQKPQLRRIHYKRKIVPPRTLDGDTRYTFFIYEKHRFLKELSEAIFVQLQLPKNVVYLGVPEPARFFESKNGYSKDCIFETKYSAGERSISFKTNQFGVFGILQKKYQNFPYKSWNMRGGQVTTLTLEGACLEITIYIISEGYSLTFDPDENSILYQLNSSWMTAEQVTEKLRSVGINIELESDADKFADICMKDPVLEDKVYDCMALLCQQCSFSSFIGRQNVGRDEISLGIGLKEGEEIKVVIHKDSVQEFSEEEENIQAEQEQKEDEARTVTEEEEQKEGEEEEEQPKEIEEPMYKNLYHFVTEGFTEKMYEINTFTDLCMIENVRSLLKICRPLSCMQ